MLTINVYFSENYFGLYCFLNEIIYEGFFERFSRKSLNILTLSIYLILVNFLNNYWLLRLLNAWAILAQDCKVLLY